MLELVSGCRVTTEIKCVFNPEDEDRTKNFMYLYEISISYSSILKYIYIGILIFTNILTRLDPNEY